MSEDPPDLDSPTRLCVADSMSGEPRWLGFNCVDADACYLTADEPGYSEQILLTRAQVEWLLAEGLPALLREMTDLK